MTPEEFLVAASAKPFVRWSTDCVGTANEWVRYRTNKSPLAAAGHEGREDFDANEWLDHPELIVFEVARAMRACGLETTKEPAIGDIGLVHYAGSVHTAIRGTDMWLTRDHNGMVGAPLNSPLLRAWRIN